MEAYKVRAAIVDARDTLGEALRAVSVPKPDAVVCWSKLFDAEASVEDAMKQLRVDFRKLGE